MQVKVTKPSGTDAKINILADEKDLATIKKNVLARLSREVKLPGFRNGKAPVALAEKSINPNILQQEVLEEAMSKFYGAVLNAEKLRPVDQPQADLKKFVPYTSLEFDITVPVIGDIKLPDYTKIKKSRTIVSITAKEVDEVVESLRKRMATRKEVERVAKSGDELTIDFKGVDSASKPVNGAEGKDYPIILGSNAFIPGFEDNLVGVSAGAEKVFTLTFPKDYGVATLANKDVTFTVTVKKITELELVAADDDFASKAGPFKTLLALKADIKKQLTLEKQQEADRKFENELIQEIAEKSSVAIPKILVDQQIERGEQEEKRNITYRGQTWQEHLDEEGVTADEHRETNRAPAELQTKSSILLSEISERENIDITPEELEVRMQILKGQYQDPKMQAELDKPESRREIASRLLTEKTIARLVEIASK